jgi:hypothetical protein
VRVQKARKVQPDLPDLPGRLVLKDLKAKRAPLGQKGLPGLLEKAVWL